MNSVMNSVIINGVEYVPATSARKSVVKIVVLQRGWVVIGRVDPEDDTSDIVTLTDASVIRVWGTTKGLGELVDGPTSKTVLDPAGTIRAHRLTTVFTIDADDDAWAGKL